MFKGIFLTLVLSLGLQANASVSIDSIFNVKQLSKQVKTQVGTFGLGWIVGETANYKLNMGPLSGTMVMSVDSENDRGFWMSQNVEIFGQKQLIEVLIDKNTGEVLEMRQNGEPADIPEEAGETEVVEQREESVTVPAGTFDAIYIKARNEKNEESEVWVNPRDIPIAGMLKQTAPGPFGKVVIELVSFKDL